MENEKLPNRGKEIHGNHNDIDENTPLSNVKAPNIFERAKEEIEALVQTIHTKSDSLSDETRDKHKEVESKHANTEKRPNFIRKAKEEIEELMHFKHSPRRHRHHKETHGQSDDLNENTPVEKVKGPSVFGRAKEEIEALVGTLHSRKESRSNVDSAKGKGGKDNK